MSVSTGKTRVKLALVSTVITTSVILGLFSCVRSRASQFTEITQYGYENSREHIAEDFDRGMIDHEENRGGFDNHVEEYKYDSEYDPNYESQYEDEYQGEGNSAPYYEDGYHDDENEGLFYEDGEPKQGEGGWWNDKPELNK